MGKYKVTKIVSICGVESSGIRKSDFSRFSEQRLMERIRSASSSATAQDHVASSPLFGHLYRTVLVPLRFRFAVVSSDQRRGLCEASDHRSPRTGRPTHVGQVLCVWVFFFLYGFAHRDLRLVWVFLFSFFVCLFLKS